MRARCWLRLPARRGCELAAEKYRKAVEALAGEIRSGVYAKDGVLPGEHELAKRLGIARETVRKAVAELIERGLVERRRGVGTFLTRRGRRKTGLLALMIPDVTSAEIFKVFSEEIERLGRRNGYKVVRGEFESRSPNALVLEARRMARQFAVERIEGVVFRPFLDERMAKTNREIVRIFRNAEIPVVLLDSDVVSPPDRSECDLVAVDNVSAGRRVAEHLVRGGRRRVAFMMSGLSIRANVNWRNRLFGVAGELALGGVENAVKILEFKPDDREALARLYRSRFRPDAIVCGNDETAVVLMRTLQKIGKRIPADVAVVGFDDAACAKSSVPPLTTVSQPSKLIAKAALRMLLARIASPSIEVKESYLPAPLAVRGST